MTTRYRNRWTVTAGVVGGLFLLSMYGRGVTTASFPTLPSRLFFGTFVTLSCWVAAAGTFFPSVSPRRDELVVDNLLFTYRIPWRRVLDVEPVGGMEIRTRGAGEIGCFAFSGSLLGALTGDRTSRRVSAAILDYRKEQADKSGDAEVTREIPVLRHVVWLVCSWPLLTWALPAILSP
ncbi:hypothetical protein [Sphaerisporangium fuscum]|uniref:hypothetical protein n=1 Tax=Sphaerisporangium fuscum TaxID=2835868 RepID=UPI001BDBD0EA|nr:hypothetical protein [Sphaerisporangium fuscum]